MPLLDEDWSAEDKAYVRLRLAQNHRELGNSETALHFLDEAEDVVPADNSLALARIHVTQAQALNDLGRFEEALTEVREIKRLEDQYNFELEFQKEVLEEARVADARGKYDTAYGLYMDALQDNVELPRNLRVDRDVRVLPHLISTLRALNRQEKASKMMGRLLESQKEHFDTRRANLIGVAEARLRLAEREAEIELLTQQRQIDSLRLRQQSLSMILAVLAAIVIFVVGTRIYSNYREQRKANQLLEARAADVRERAQYAEEALAQRETMLLELDHRLKNNLQTILSLLNVQSRNMGEEAAGQASGIFQDIIHRVHTMALIQRRLVPRAGVPTTVARDFIAELTEQLVETVGKPVDINITAGPWAFNESVSAPLALIVNELVSNSLKHAFGEKGGRLTITLDESAPNEFVLSVQDDGIGLPRFFNIDKLNSMGMQLVQSLSQQIDGELNFESNQQGVKWMVSFRATPA